MMFDDLTRRRDEENRMREEGRMPPGQSLTRKFPVLHYGPVPAVNLNTWDLRVWGEVEEELRWNWEEFNKLPRTRITLDIHCVTRWSKFDTAWDGVPLRTLMDEGFIKPKESARYLLQHAEYGYTTNLPLEVALGDNFMLATHFNNQPLTPEHGFPLRGVIGHITSKEYLTVPYLWKGAKWLRGLEFMSEDRMGFWEQAGYHNEADVWKEQRIA
jgi:DMSO/TMAO reductase YedYZ molybdopterin-dependent catalytic subunit